MNITFKNKNRKRSILLMIPIILIMIIACSAQQQVHTEAKWPAISKETKPWARWWWQGSSVNKKDLTKVMEEYKAAGIGGLEITPIYGVRGEEDHFVEYLSPEWMDLLAYTLKEAERLDIGIDMATGTGWPFGGSWIGSNDACKYMTYKVYELKGGQRLDEKITFIQEPIARAVRKRIDISEVIEPISSNKNLQELALDQIRFKKQLPLQTVMAYSSKGDHLEITDKVNDSGELDWIAPEGEWKLYAVFQGWHGKMVERAAPGGEGNVIDHFSESALKNYLHKFDLAFKDHNNLSIRAFFNDSYEVDDARGESDYTPDFFTEFKNHRGYDLKLYLPALFGNDDEEKVSRVRCDYRETISDLLLEKFTIPWREWAKSHKAIVRDQAHGSPANILDLYAASGIPETEGITPKRIKMATSAGHVSGKSLISCEAATWLDEHFMANLSEVKMDFDRYFTHGVNHIVYHGTPYSPLSAEWPGWMFYAAVHFAPTNTWWEDMKILNAYVANCQSFLQNSVPDNDILLYFPIYDAWSEKGRSMLRHFGRSDEELTKDLSEMLITNGYTFDYISDMQIQNLQVHGQMIQTNDAEYKTIILPKCEYIPFQTIQKIIGMVQQGAIVVLQDGFPKNVPGLYNLKDRQDSYNELIKDISFVNQDETEISKIDKGKIIKGKDIETVLAAANVYPESMVKSGLWFYRVIREEGICYFISNWGDNDIDQWIDLNSSGKDAVWFNPMNKEFGRAKTKNISGGHTQVYIQLAKGESLILQLYPEEQIVEKYPIFEKTDDILALEGEWKIEFLKGGPTLPEPYVTKELKSWTTHSDELKWFSGTARYNTMFEMTSIDAPVYSLDLGEVFTSAVVYLNGERLETLVGPEFHLTINADMLQKSNNLEIYVTNLMANRIIDLDKRGINYKKFYNINFAARKREDVGADGLFTAKNWNPLDSGLLGPVTITALKYKN